MNLRDAIAHAARSGNVRPDCLLALCLKETNGELSSGRCVISTEGHVFYRNLTGAKRERAVAEGLAWPSWDLSRHPRTQKIAYARLARMRAIDKEAAFKSVGMGWGQVLGENFADLGFASAGEMWNRAQSIEGQSELVMRFLLANKLAGHLNRLPDPVAARKFARGYNGRGYKKNRYDTLLIRHYDDIVTGRWKDPAARRASIVDLQEDLATLGYQPGPADGVMGPTTRAAVRAFQGDAGIAIDGVPGPMTRRKIDERLAALAEKSRPAKSGAAGAGAIGTVTAGTILAAGDKIADVATGTQGIVESFGVPPGLVALVAAPIAGYLVWRFIIQPMRREAPA